MKTSQRWKESNNEKVFFMNAIYNPSDQRIHSVNHTIKPVNFYCPAREAKAVRLSGDFNHWHPILMQQREDGWWFIQVWLSHGHHQYRFLVDEKPVLDPQATGTGRDEHDQPVSLVAVS